MIKIFIYSNILFFCFTAVAIEKWTLFHYNDLDCKSPPSGYEIKGDFDGNGKPDIAKLQANKKIKKRRLAVWMNGQSKPIILDIKPEDKAGNCLNLMQPGTVEPFIDSKDKTPVKVEYEYLVIPQLLGNQR